MAWRLPANGGPRSWLPSRDKDGHRTYKVVYRLFTDDAHDTCSIFETPGLPLPGAYFALGNDSDPDAYCTPEIEPRVASEIKEGKPITAMDLAYTFTTKPIQQCQDVRIDNPLLQPPKVSIDFSEYKVAATKDRFGNPIVTSSHELITGPTVEFPETRFAVKVEMNVGAIDLGFLGPFNNTVNSTPLWGVPRRCVRFMLKNVSVNYYGVCLRYYTLHCEFEVFTIRDPDTNQIISGFDVDLLDEGTKVLSGRWDEASSGASWKLLAVGAGSSVNHPSVAGYNASLPLNPNPKVPSHFIKFQDRQGHISRVVLDGEGKPFNPDSTKLINLVGTSACAGLLGAQCAEVPEKWTVVGMEDGPYELTFDSSSNNCVWTKTITSNRTLTLSRGGFTWVLSDELSNSSTFSTYWTMPFSQFKCLGPNSFVKQSGPGPDVVSLVYRAGKPGKVHVEKFQESNFFLLSSNLPLSL